MNLKDKNIGVIAGSGDLPYAVIAAIQDGGGTPYVLAIDGSAHSENFPVDGQTVGIAQFGKLKKALNRHGCEDIVFAGYVRRPDFKTLKPDMKAVKYVPGAIQAASKGDNALLTYLISVFEKEGFRVISPQEICTGLLMPVGALGQVSPAPEDHADINRAMEIAAAIGRHDIGQSAIVCNGLTLAVEAQEGTDMMLERIATLDPDIRGQIDDRKGVLAKRVKPGQEERVDLPTIGPTTIEHAAQVGLKGVVLEAGRAFVMNRESVVRLADSYGLFVVGIEPV